MLAASLPPSSYSQEPSLRRRAVALATAAAANALIILMLLGLAPAILRRPLVDRGPVTVQLLPEAPEEHARTHTPTRKRTGGGSPLRARVPTPAAAARIAPPTPPLPMMILSHEEMAAADISKMAHAPAALAGTGAGSGRTAGDSVGIGKAPGGETLYNADWYRQPTNAELSTYLPPSAPREGWGEIVCRTVANYRVEDCQQLGDYPEGSGLARAVLNAAWQFRVLPPRVGGHPMVGTWVRIRIDYSSTKG